MRLGRKLVWRLLQHAVMKTTNTTRKTLRLDRETLKHITSTELDNVRGGVALGQALTDQDHSCNPACFVPNQV